MIIAPRDLLALVGLNAIWGLNYVVSRYAVEHFPPILFTTLRFAVLAVCVLPWLRWRRGEMTRLLIGSVCSGAAQFALLFLALRLTRSVASLSIAAQLGVPFATLLSVLLLRERLALRQWIGVVVAFGGVVLLGFDHEHIDHVIALLLVAGSALAAAVGIVALKSMGERLEPTEVIAWFAWSGWPVLLLLTLVFEHGQLESIEAARLPEWGCLLYTALLSSLGAYTAFFYFVRRYPVSVLVPVNLLSTVFAIESSILFLGEVLTARIAIAAACTVAGVLLIVLSGATRGPDRGPRIALLES